MNCINESILICCAVLATAAILIAVIYLVITLKQITQTAKKMEETLDKTNREIDSVHKISDGVITVASLLPKTWIKVVSTVLPLVTPYIFKKKK